MNKAAYSVLCGGTFFTQLVQSKKSTASRRERTQGAKDIYREPDAMFELVRLVNPDYVRPAGDTFKTYTTNYKKCVKQAPDDWEFENENVISAFLARLEADYASELNKATGFTRRFIEVGTATRNDELLTKRLIELIRDDEGISPETLFVVGKDGASITKKTSPQ